MKKYVSTGKWPKDIICTSLLYSANIPYGCFMEYLDYFDRGDHSFSYVVDVVMKNRGKFPQFITWLIMCGYVKEVEEKPHFKIGDVIQCWNKDDGVMEYYLIAAVGVDQIALIDLFSGLRWEDPITVSSVDSIPYDVIVEHVMLDDNDANAAFDWKLDQRRTCAKIIFKAREVDSEQIDC